MCVPPLLLQPSHLGLEARVSELGLFRTLPSEPYSPGGREASLMVSEKTALILHPGNSEGEVELRMQTKVET